MSDGCRASRGRSGLARQPCVHGSCLPPIVYMQIVYESTICPRKKPSLVRSVPRLPHLFQQPDQVFQIARRQMTQQLAVEGDQRLIEVSQDPGPLVGQRHIDDPTILLATQSVDKARLLQPVNEARDPRYNRDAAAGELQAG